MYISTLLSYDTVGFLKVNISHNDNTNDNDRDGSPANKTTTYKYVRTFVCVCRY